jgi:iron-sulfur cluster assembly protein
MDVMWDVTRTGRHALSGVAGAHDGAQAERVRTTVRRSSSPTTGTPGMRIPSAPRRCAVLILTATAADTVRQLMASARAAAEPHAGVRISAAKARAADTSVDITLVDEPETTDRTVEEAGARVFVDEGAAEFLQDKVLDAAVDARGVRFTILAQKSGAQGQGEWAT